MRKRELTNNNLVNTY